MFQLDDTFLEEVGLSAMPKEQKKAFLQHIYDELELRVGTRLSDGMSDAQLEEFEAIIDRKDDIISAWLAKHVPDYHNDQAFGRIQQATGLDINDLGLKAEYTATKWLEVNRPDYRDVVASVLGELKKEVTSNKDTILGSQAAA